MRRCGLFLLAVLVAGCGVPVQVSREDARTVHRELTRNVLTAGEPSDASLNVLQQWGLADTTTNRYRRWADSPHLLEPIARICWSR